MDNLQHFRRTDYCGTFTAANVGQEISVCGWVQRQRNLGSLIFVDLRDRTGLVQLSFDDSTAKEIFEKASALRSEYVVAATGLVRERESKTNKITTGDIEVYVSELRLLAKAETPPFEIVENSKANDMLRLKYRYLDLRRPDMQHAIATRHKVTKVARDYFDEQGFLEIETPMLTKSTPEGARDYLVPSRVHPGKFYALPQSPQQYKQLLMLSGFDRYMQIARCFRDEDLRADRQPEFTQIDLEMSFVNEDDVMDIQEGFLKRVFKEVLDVDVQTPFLRLPWREAMDRFGSDKPDMRFGFELKDLGDIVSGCGFKVFTGALESGGIVNAVNISGGAEKFIGAALEKYPRESFYLATKMPLWKLETQEDMEQVFNEQLANCRVDYFDFYLCHAVDAERFEKIRRIGAFEFLAQKKAEGKLRRLGFSFHDKPAVLRAICAASPWDFAQLQLNYLDWTVQRAREQYEILQEYGLPCIVMEPVRGGALASLCPEAEAVLKAMAQPVRRCEDLILDGMNLIWLKNQK